MNKLSFKETFKKSGIYSIRSKTSGKIYIGSSSNLYHRIVCHINSLKAGRHDNIILQRTYNKHGPEDLKCEVVEFCDKDILITREQFWINNTNCLAPSGLNIQPIAERGFHLPHSEETKRKIGKANKGKPSPMKGRSQTKESRRRMSISKTILGIKPPNRVKVKLTDKRGQEYLFDSISEGAAKYKISIGAIHNNITGLSKSTKHGIWQKVE